MALAVHAAVPFERALIGFEVSEEFDFTAGRQYTGGSDFPVLSEGLATLTS